MHIQKRAQRWTYVVANAFFEIDLNTARHILCGLTRMLNFAEIGLNLSGEATVYDYSVSFRCIFGKTTHSGYLQRIIAFVELIHDKQSASDHER